MDSISFSSSRNVIAQTIYTSDSSTNPSQNTADLASSGAADVDTVTISEESLKLSTIGAEEDGSEAQNVNDENVQSVGGSKQNVQHP
jgi:hypothetical protein